MRGIFVLGTDTGVGKTAVACAIARAVRSRGLRVRAVKPVATGSAPGRHPDILDLAEASHQVYTEISCWEGIAATAPSLASRLEDKTLDISEIVSRIRSMDSGSPFFVIEGAGGVLCPLGRGVAVADLAGALGLPCVLVARRCLGTLNHILLSLEACASRGLRVAGIVMNAVKPALDLASREAAAEIRRLCDAPVIGEVGFGEDHGAALAEVAWERLASETEGE
ncbi:MAG: dethiobiotin synthase [Planctomycetes bacterium]|nr:dethiobiotin synthase [Planctomycetota bacterium]